MIAHNMKDGGFAQPMVEITAKDKRVRCKDLDTYILKRKV